MITPIIKDLREVRIALRISQQKLAYIAGYDSNSISKWENGRNQPSIDAVTNIAKALGFHLKLVKAEY